MKRRDDDFEARIAPPRGDRGGSRYITRVLRALSAAGGKRKGNFKAPLSRRLQAGPVAGRGLVAARMLRDQIGPRARRVVVKARLVQGRQASANAISPHLRYIMREGITRDGEPGRAYGADVDQVDVEAFDAKGRRDRHQFRFIVGPEDSEALADLRGFTRDLMHGMEKDLGTRLDWIAVDHWDTDNPHTHIVLRGKDEAGKDLVIAREYVSHGMRLRASLLATEWLGPRTERELKEAISKEVGQERWTGLDLQLQKQARGDLIEIRELPRSHQTALVGRLQRLQELGLAEREAAGVWRVQPDFEPTLRALGERGDIVRTMQRSVGVQREIVVHAEGHPKREIVGKVVGAAFLDELNERAALIVDATDGRAHALPLPRGTPLDRYPIGAIVRAGGERAFSAADRNIAALSRDGMYSPSAQSVGAAGPRESVRRLHLRRLEALRRAGIVERVNEALWRVPQDLVEQGRRYDLGKARRVGPELLSRFPVERQVSAIAATWLDAQSQDEIGALASNGFGAEVRDALQRRHHFLVDGGHAEPDQQGAVRLTDAILARLRAADVSRAGDRLSAELGLSIRKPIPGVSIKGTYRQSIWLASGQFAMLERDGGFALVPWHPVLEGRIGQAVSVAMRGSVADWTVGSERSLGR